MKIMFQAKYVFDPHKILVSNWKIKRRKIPTGNNKQKIYFITVKILIIDNHLIFKVVVGICLFNIL